MQVRVAPLQKRKSQTLVEINWHRLYYTVKKPKYPFFNDGDRYKTILNGVSGSLRSGQVCVTLPYKIKIQLINSCTVRGPYGSVGCG